MDLDTWFIHHACTLNVSPSLKSEFSHARKLTTCTLDSKARIALTLPGGLVQHRERPGQWLLGSGTKRVLYIYLHRDFGLEIGTLLLDVKNITDKSSGWS